MGVNESGSAALAAILNGGFADCIAFEWIRAIAFGNVQAGEIPREFGDAAARGLNFDRDGDGIAVIFDQVKKGKLLGARGVQGFPEFAFAGGAIAAGNENDFIALVANMLAERRVFGPCQGLRTCFVIQSGFRSAHGLYKLRAGAGGLVDDVQAGVAPVRRHLAAAGAGIILCADSLKEHLDRLHAEHQAESAVAIIGIDPIDAGTKKKPHGGGDGLVARAGDLKENFVLALELDFAVVQTARKVHGAVNADERVVVEVVQLRGIKLGKFDARL